MGLFGGGSPEAAAKIRINYDGKDAERGLSSLKKTVGSVISVYALKMVYDYASALDKAAREGLATEKTFRKLGFNVELATRSMKKATMGMLEDTVLQQKAIRAQLSGINFNDFLVALEYASKYAISTGRNVEEVLDQIVQGFTTGRTISLRQVGIVINDSKNVIKDATDQMKMKTKELSVDFNDAEVASRRLNASFEDLKETIGRKLEPAFTSLRRVMADLIEPYINPEEFKINAEIKTTEAVIESLKKKIEQGPSGIEKFLSKINQASGGVDYANQSKASLEQTIHTVESSLKILKEKRDAILGAGSNGKIAPDATPAGPSPEELEKRAKKAQAIRDLLADDELSSRANAVKDLEDLEKEHAGEGEKIYQQDLENRVQLDQDVTKIQRDLLSESADGRKRLVYEEYLQKYLTLQKAGEDTTALDSWMQGEMTRIEKEESDKRIKTADDENQKKINALNSFINLSSTVTSGLQSLSNAQTNRELENLDKKKLGERRYNKERAKILEEQKEQSRSFARAQQAIVLAQTYSMTAQAAMNSLKDMPPYLKWIDMAAVIAAGATQIATINAQNFQGGYLGEVDRARRPDDMNARIGRNEAVIPGPQYAMHEEDVRAIVNNTANTAAGMRGLKGGGVVQNFYGLSAEQVIAVQRNSQRRNTTGRLV